MMMDRWNDERLDELNERLKRVEGVYTDVAVMKRDMRAITASQEKMEKRFASLSEKLEEAIDAPLVRGRDLRRQLLIGGVAAAIGGFATFVAALAAGLIQ